MWLLLLLIPNYLSSWYVARTVAQCWRGAQVTGRWAVLLCWGGAALAALGFTWSYLVLSLLAAHYFGLVVASWIQTVVDVGHVIVTASIVTAGLIVAAEALWGRSGRAAAATAENEPDEDGRGLDPAMIVLYLILAGTAILGVVQTYLIIRAGTATPQVAQRTMRGNNRQAS